METMQSAARINAYNEDFAATASALADAFAQVSIANRLAAARHRLMRRIDLDAQLAHDRAALMFATGRGMGLAAVTFWCDNHRARALAHFDLQWGCAGVAGLKGRQW